MGGVKTPFPIFMYMRIYLEQLANEALGIPDGILEMADVVYEEMMNEWAMDMEKNKYKYPQILGKGSDVSFILRGPYTIKDETWNNIEVKIDIQTFQKQGNLRYDSIFAGAAFSYQSSLEQNAKYLKTVPNSTIPLTFNFVFNEDNTWEDVYDFANTESEGKIREVLSHELKHAFDSRKKTDQKFTSRSRYNIATQQIGIPSLYFFNYKVYYTHYVENLVRPVEFAKHLQNKKVTKQEFLQKLKDSDVYKILDEIRDYSYDKLVQSVIEDKRAMQYATQMVGNSGGDVDMLDETQLAEIVLESNYNQVIEAQKDNYLQAASDSFDEYSKFLSGNYGDEGSDKAKAVKDVMADLDRFGKNYKAFYKYEIKKMNMLAEKILRKLAKLYAYIQ
jgi:hypothetical protein